MYKAWNRGGLTSEWAQVKGKWRLWQKCHMKLAAELECVWRLDGGETRKWKDCAKRIKKKEGRRLLKAFGGYLRSPRAEKYICTYTARQTNTPTASLSLSDLHSHSHTQTNLSTPWLQYVEGAYATTLSLSVFDFLSSHYSWSQFKLKT